MNKAVQLLGTFARQSTKDPKHWPKANLTVGPRPIQFAIVNTEKLVLDRCRLATKKMYYRGSRRGRATTLGSSYYPVAMMVLVLPIDI